MNDLEIYWCPICEIQTPRPWHTASRPAPLIPQLDVEHECERIKVVPVVEIEQLRKALKLAYPYVKDAAQEGSAAVRQLVKEDLDFIGPVLAKEGYA